MGLGSNYSAVVADHAMDSALLAALDSGSAGVACCRCRNSCCNPRISSKRFERPTVGCHRRSSRPTDRVDRRAYIVEISLARLYTFRGFDIVKPPALRRLEQLPEGVGVVVDDVGAGLYALVVMQAVLHFGWLPR